MCFSEDSSFCVLYSREDIIIWNLLTGEALYDEYDYEHSHYRKGINCVVISEKNQFCIVGGIEGLFIYSIKYGVCIKEVTDIRDVESVIMVENDLKCIGVSNGKVFIYELSTGDIKLLDIYEVKQIFAIPNTSICIAIGKEKATIFTYKTLEKLKIIKLEKEMLDCVYSHYHKALFFTDISGRLYLADIENLNTLFEFQYIDDCYIKDCNFKGIMTDNKTRGILYQNNAIVEN